MKAIYKWTVLAIAVSVIFFALQNMARIDVSILFWVLRPHLSVVIFSSFAVGLIAGWLVHILRRSPSARERNTPLG